MCPQSNTGGCAGTEAIKAYKETASSGRQPASLSLEAQLPKGSELIRTEQKRQHVAAAAARFKAIFKVVLFEDRAQM